MWFLVGSYALKRFKKNKSELFGKEKSKISFCEKNNVFRNIHGYGPDGGV